MSTRSAAFALALLLSASVVIGQGLTLAVEGLLPAATPASAPDEGVEALSAHTWTHHQSHAIPASAGMGRACAWLYRSEVPQERPADLSGALVEVQWQSAYADELPGRLEVVVIADETAIASSAETDERRVIAVRVDPSLWRSERLSVAFCQSDSGKLPATVLDASVDLYVTIFQGGGMPRGFTAVR